MLDASDFHAMDRHDSMDGSPSQAQNDSSAHLSAGTHLDAQHMPPPDHIDSVKPSELSIEDAAPSDQHIAPTVQSMQETFSMLQSGDPLYNNSSFSLGDEFAAWLFEDADGFLNAPFSVSAANGMGFADASNLLGDAAQPHYFGAPALGDVEPEPAQTQQNELIEPALDQSSHTILSHTTRQSLITLMQSRFNDSDNADISLLRDEVFQGDLDASDHVLSMRSMQNYIAAYWRRFHPQMPILHEPTFQADNVHSYLLLSIMTIGAAYLDKGHGRLATGAASRLATFIAWHLRWLIFMHQDFHPPAKLWVFQALILLEVYEKMHATRRLHERAHINHATVINLLRRGTGLVEAAGETLSREASTPDEWWNRWITVEATRRAIYAAFFLDTVQAIMFSHAAIMVVHEIRLTLPCDDALWSATSAAEVCRIEASFHANDIKPITFLDALKKTLTGRKVRSSDFGRLILLTGLLSISWHMNQRDLQSTSLDASQIVGAPSNWKESLTASLEFWKKCFDKNIEHMRKVSCPWQQSSVGSDEDIAKNATTLYHLGYIMMHSDIIACEILAGAKRIVGRVIDNTDYERARYKIIDWAKGSSAKIGVYHALQVLKQETFAQGRLYDARNDRSLARPWSLHTAALVVWAYGFATDGPLRPFPSHMEVVHSPDTYMFSNPLVHYLPDGPNEPHVDAIVEDAQSFFGEVGSVRNPDDLDLFSKGRNQVVGMLMILEAACHDSEWELLRGEAQLFRNAIVILKGGDLSGRHLHPART